ncbi:MAG: hypothetical protein M3Q81_03220 [bacterium]|nr:hypothetical protein [bacterium]
MSRKLIVTHHAPDLDAIGAVWLLKRFDAQEYADAKVAFVNPGSTITLEEAEESGMQLHEVTHVDTGLGEFDHHQPDRGQQFICATSLVFEYISKKYPDIANDEVLKSIVTIVNEVDHFHEIFWPEASHLRYGFMIHELIRGMEFTDPHDDDSQLHFGFQCLDNAYASMTQQLKAIEIISEKGQEFSLKAGKCLALETRNDDTIKVAQKQGFMVVVRKDTESGHIRIKARPDAELDLKAAADRILEVDKIGTWYYHPSGKMLINGSIKHRNQKPSKLPLEQVVSILKELYG